MLDNGLRVSRYPFPQLQTVGIAFGVGFGSIDENPRVNGSAHFLEHMLFKGTKRRTWKQIDDDVKNLGAYKNAFTDHETTIYFMQVYKSHFEKVMDILSDMVTNSTLPEKEFELERGPIMNENLIRHDNPMFMMYDYLPRALYKKHPARMSISGDNDKTIAKMQRGDLLRIYPSYYTPSNGVLAVYGGVSHVRAKAAAQKCFGGLSGSRKPARHKESERSERRSITVVRKGIKQTRIGIGFKCRGFSPDATDEFVSLSVLAKYLNGKLFEEVRQKHGLSYDPMANYNPYGTFGFIAGGAGTEPGKIGDVKEIMLGEFEKLQNGEINAEELNRTKGALYIQSKMRLESTMGMAISMASFDLSYGGSQLLESFPELVKKVTLDDVRKYAGKYIDVDKYGMVVLKPG